MGEDKSLDNDAVQATEAARPVYLTNQINSIYPTWRFDGIDDCLKAVAFTWNRPEVVYIVFKPIVWSVNDTIFDGNTFNTLRLFQANSASRHYVYAGQGDYLDRYVEINNGILAIVRCRFTATDGIAIRLNNGAEQVTGNATSNAGGFTLGAGGDGTTACANIDFAEAFGYNVVPTPTEDALAMAYLNARYAIY